MEYQYPNKCTNYAKYQDFGTTLNPLLETDPVELSIYNDPDTYFLMGPTAYLFGPQTEPSQLYMAQKCSKNWDGSCEYLSRNIEPTKENKATLSSKVFKCEPNITIGDTLIDNAAQRRYAVDIGKKCVPNYKKYNPLDPTSPDVVTYECGLNNIVCLPPPASMVDSDVLMNKLLDAPEKHVSILKNFYINLGINKAEYNGTRLGKIFELFDAYIKVYGCLN
jgi:hypothetical protein